jgi:outer membrane protein assembly factor BamB
MRIDRSFFTCLLFVALFAGADAVVAGATGSDWPMFHRDQALTGITPETLPDSLHLLWKFKTGGPVFSSPAIVGNQVFVGSNDDRIYALDIESGSPSWTFETEDDVESSPLVLEGSVYAGSADSHLYCLDMESGQMKWKYKTGDRVLCGPNWCLTGADQPPSIVFGSYDGKLHCVDSAAGTRLWTYETENYVNGSPAVADGRTVAGGCDAQVHIVSVTDGHRLGIVDAGAYIAGSVTLGNGKAYVGHYGNEFIAVDLAEATVSWTYKDRAFPFFSSPALGGDRVVVGSRDKRLHCIRSENGEPIWSFRTRGKVDSSPIICGTKVVTGSDDGRLYVVNLSDGSEVWAFELGEGITGAPAFAHGRLVVGCEDGFVYAFGARAD